MGSTTVWASITLGRQVSAPVERTSLWFHDTELHPVDLITWDKGKLEWAIARGEIGYLIIFQKNQNGLKVWVRHVPTYGWKK